MSRKKMVGNKWVSFDLDGTLIDFSFVDSVWLEGIPRLYSIKKGVSFDNARKAVKREYDKIGNEELQWYDLHYWIKKFGLNFGWQDLLSRFEDRIRIYPEVSKVLEDLTQRGFRLIIITNASTEFLEFQLASTNIRGYFEAVFFCNFGFWVGQKNSRPFSKNMQYPRDLPI